MQSGDLVSCPKGNVRVLRVMTNMVRVIQYRNNRPVAFVRPKDYFKPLFCPASHWKPLTELERCLAVSSLAALHKAA